MSELLKHVIIDLIVWGQGVFREEGVILHIFSPAERSIVSLTGPLLCLNDSICGFLQDLSLCTYFIANITEKEQNEAFCLCFQLRCRSL